MSTPVTPGITTAEADARERRAVDRTRTVTLRAADPAQGSAETVLVTYSRETWTYTEALAFNVAVENRPEETSEWTRVVWTACHSASVWCWEGSE